MAHLSLRERVSVIRNKFDMPKFTHSTLRSIYLRNNAKFRSPRYQYAAKYEKSVELVAQQQNYSREITSRLINHHQIVYIDETSFNMWQRPSRMWLAKAHQDLRIPTKRGRSFTLIGAISTRHGMVHFKMLEESNTNATFKEFFTELLEILSNESCTIVMDNLR